MQVTVPFHWTREVVHGNLCFSVLKNFIRVVGDMFCLGVVCSLDSASERLGRLKPDEKVAVAIDMTDACVRVCADGIRAQYLGISEEELLAKLRERLEWGKRGRGR